MIEEVLFNTPRSLLEAISPLSGLFLGEPRIGRFIFRGQGDAQHQLMPSAFRQGAYNLEFSLVSDRDQVKFEAKELLKFLKAADAQGLRIPGDSHELRRHLDSQALIADNVREWPPPMAYPLMALAQHYGMATRLLDFTFDPFVAAYFAAESGRKSSESEYIAVWLLRSDPIEMDGYIIDDPPEEQIPVQIITAPSSEIDNLRAQRGLFVLYKLPSSGFRFNVMPLEQVLLVHRGFKESHAQIWKLMLHVEHINELQRLLWHMNVHHASMFPGFWSLADHVRRTDAWNTIDAVKVKNSKYKEELLLERTRIAEKNNIDVEKINRDDAVNFFSKSSE